MTRKEQIKSAYKQLGGSANFYDGTISTEKYTFLPKEETVFCLKEFDEVTILRELPSFQNEPQQ